MLVGCAICEKTTQVGRSQQHRRGIAGKRWKKRAQSTPRVFKANLQVRTMLINGKKQKVKICAKCLKRQKKDSKDKSLQA